MLRTNETTPSPRFERMTINTVVVTSPVCVLWYHPNGVHDEMSVAVTRDCNPVVAPWLVMEAEAVMKFFIPDWKTMSNEEFRKVEPFIVDSIDSVRCNWVSVFAQNVH